MEFRTKPWTQRKQYLIKQAGWDNIHNSWIYAEDIDGAILKEFQNNGNKERTFRPRKGKSTSNRKKTLDMIVAEKVRVMRLKD